jgi:succinate-acetate transporter protein
MGEEKPKTANPAPLGLLAFGMTTVLLNFLNTANTFDAKIKPFDTMIIGMGIFYGGIAQIIAGILEYKKGNTFGTVAFTSFGMFWLSFVSLNWLNANLSTSAIWPFYGTSTGVNPWAVSGEALMAYFFIWGLFTFLMFFGTLRTNRALQFVFMSLAILFFLLTIEFGLLTYYPTISSTAIDWFARIVGVEGMICGFSAIYLGAAEVLNETEHKTVLPIGPVGPI